MKQRGGGYIINIRHWPASTRTHRWALTTLRSLA
jgi:hypothetical protein